MVEHVEELRAEFDSRSFTKTTFAKLGQEKWTTQRTRIDSLDAERRITSGNYISRLVYLSCDRGLRAWELVVGAPTGS